MKGRILVATTALALAWVAGTSLAASAADIIFMCAPALQPAVQKLVPEFENRSGHKVKVIYGSIGVNAARVRNGEEADLAIVSPQQGEGLQNDGKLSSAERTVIGKVGVGIFVKKGASRPDASSVDALKLTLLRAPSIAVGDLRTPVGAYMLPLFEKLGINNEISSKLKLMPPGNPSPTIESVIKGEAEIGFSQMSEIAASQDADAVGPLPASIQNFTTFTAAIPIQAKQVAAALELIRFLRTPIALAAFKSAGIEAD